MPKQKTRTTVAKRFTVTKSGKVKSSKRKRNLRKGYYLEGQVANNIKRQLPY